MEKLLLSSKVVVRGPDYWGRPSWITFEPHNKPGWWWDTGAGTVPIDRTIVSPQIRRIALAHDDIEFHVWEHVGALRFTGLDRVRVSCERFTGFLDGCWPPYDGCSRSYWEALKSNVTRTGTSMSWRQVPAQAVWSYPEQPWRSTGIYPIDLSDGMQVVVKTSYPKLGCHHEKRVFDNNDPFLEYLFSTRSQGWPLWTYWPATLIERSRFPIRFRPSCMTWPQVVGRETASKLFNHHRVLDVLGAMSLIYHEALPACSVVSVCSGHLGDVQALKML